MLRQGSTAPGGARYRVLEPLGIGGFGAVYEAIDTRTGQRVALKELGDGSGDSISRFKQEFRALSDFHHPNLVSLKELIEQDGRWVIAMELVPGTDFLNYVGEKDAGEVWRFDEARLRGALSGIVSGLRALHGYGILHRDLKPSNVRVTPEGRAVLLDFGLVTSIRPEQQSTHAVGLGTVSYMAPEQGMGQQLGPQADVYALGVCLFEALTGRLPYRGTTAVEVILRKQAAVAPLASSLAPGVPRDLDALCSRMLAIDPTQRPDLREIQIVLSGGTVDSLVSSWSSPPVAGEEAFSGRETELSNLDRALAQTHDGALRVVLVEGESGIGKSELSSEFVRRAQLVHPKLLVLRGRCYENEQVSYKAFDGCVDELSKVLRKRDCTALLPPRATLLGQMFPVLRKVPAIAQAPREDTSADPTARRLEAFTALVSLLGKIAEERPLVLLVDDLQWADSESFRLLQALVESPERPSLLLLGTIRPRAELEPDVLAHVTQIRKWPETSVIELLGLPLPQAKALAQKLLGRSAPDSWFTMVARESEGSPLFLAELVRYVESHDLRASGTLRLDDALRARIGKLDRASSELLELVALAGRPYGTHVFARALGVDSVEDAARTLLAAKLLRVRKGQDLSCFHDRIRQSAVDLIPRMRLAGLHRRLAEALAQTPLADPSEQARHWDLAGEREQASAAYELAAKQGLEALAFARAEALFARALALVDDLFDPRAHRLLVQRANTLACAGRSGEAASLFRMAAERTHGDERIQLRIASAKHLILSAKIAEGLAAVKKLLDELGYHLPKHRTALFLRYAWELLRIALQRAKPWPGRTESSDPRMHHAQMIFPVTTNFDPLGYLILLQQYVRRAGRGGSDLDAARAAGLRGWFRVLQGSVEAGTQLLAKAREVIDAQGTPALRATQWFLEASAHIARAQWAEAAERLLPAQQLLREQCPDLSWLLLNVRYHLSSTWYNTGDHARLATEVDVWMAEARERNDMVSVALIAGMGFGSIRHLMADAPEKAVTELQQAMESVPKEPFSFLQLGALIGIYHAKLYQGGTSALRFVEATEHEHRSAFLMQTPVVRDARLMLRGHALLRAACVSDEREREPQFAQVKRIGMKLIRSHMSFSRAIGHLLLAQVDALTGRSADALTRARKARSDLDDLQHSHRRAARYLEGVLEGGERGEAQCQSVLAELKQAGWQNPLRAVELTAASIPLLRRTSETERLPGASLLRGRYEVLEALGAGGFGSVFKVRDVQTGRQLAVKELIREGGLPLQRFKQEFRALQEVQHRNIVQIEALFESAGCWYIAMELIEGDDLIRYARPAGSCDVTRLCTAFLGMVEGLSALHDAGFVHRDVRPANVRVTADGRAVLLDFGLVARIGDTASAGAVGTPEDAAPEQLEGTPPDPSADVFALGSCLYRALSGAAPFVASTPPALLAAKREQTPRPPVVPALPELVACCMRMLSKSASSRPTLREVRDALRSAAGNTRAAPVAADVLKASEASFSGRARELEALHARALGVRARGLRLVLVEGESGMGKSALVAEFARRAADGQDKVQALTSRCYENEQIALKAFDGAVDRLAQLLCGLSAAECERLLPKRAALLSQIFPVLSSVPAIAHASKKGLPIDPALRQIAARECFLQLLEKLSAEFSLMFVIDDIQWADSESFRLLDGLIADAKHLPILLIATVRPSDELGDERVVRALAALRARAETELIELGGLSAADATALITSLSSAPLPAETSARIVAQSKGHPLFLRELVAQASADKQPALVPTSLDDALRARIEQFAPDAQTLLSLVALGGRPYGHHVYARALAIRSLSPEVVTVLLVNGFLRRRGEQELACYHDRIRRVALAMLAPAARIRHARALAEALELEQEVGAAERARLWDEAGDAERAIAAYEQAGERALSSLAFTRAEQQFARALSLHGPERDERWRRLTIQRGHAFARSGRSAEAAAVYEAAAEGAPREQQVHLRISVAQHLLRSAQVDTGLQAATALLAELGESVPRSERAALSRIAWEDVRIRLRGGKPRASRSQLSADERIALDAMSALSPIFSAVTPYRGTALTLRFLRRALDAGVPKLTARALALEAMWEAIRRPDRDQTAQFERSRALADELGDPFLIASIENAWGMACMQNSVRAAPIHLSIAHEIVQSRCPGEPWLLTITRTSLGTSWSYGGDFASLLRHMDGWMHEATSCQDKFAMASLPTFGSGALRHILPGRCAEALAEIDEVMAPWPMSNFSYLHFGAFVQRAAARTSAGDARTLAWLEHEERTLRQQLLMRMPTCRLALDKVRVTALLLTLASRNDPRLPAVLAQVKRAVAALARNTSQPGPGTALLAAAVVDALETKAAQALTKARAARERLQAAGNYTEPGALYLEGWLEGGEQGRQRCAAALQVFAGQGWSDPRCGLAVCLPGAHLFT